MANIVQKTCWKFSNFGSIPLNLFMFKASVTHPLYKNFLPNAFGSKRFIHLEGKFCNLLTEMRNRPDCVNVLCGGSVLCVRWAHMTSSLFGIEEFFPPGVLENQQPLPEEVKSGRSWRAAELRQKSNEDLHKLWYVLLKERNMLLTVHEEAKRQEVVVPSPERLHKVKKSMAMIKVVLDERKRAIEDIETNYKEAQKNLIDFDDSESGKKLVDTSSEEHVSRVPIPT